MTREEAREWFKNALWNNDFFPETEDAFKVAIEALSAEPQFIIEKYFLKKVVRCKDCRHYEDGMMGYCWKTNRGVADDFFCAYGERWSNDER